MPDLFLSAEIDLIVWLQTHLGWLVPAMKGFSFIGFTEFYIVVLTAIYWCIDASLGLRLGLLVALAGVANDLLKLIFHEPRPFWVDHQVLNFGHEKSFGLPSGHAQVAAAMWGGLAACLNRKPVWVGALVLVFLIGYSRIQLGVHFPSQVAAGFLAGGVMVLAFAVLQPGLSRWLAGQARPAVFFWALGLSLACLAVGAAVVSGLGDWSLPAEWLSNAAQAGPAGVKIDPVRLKNVASNAGIFSGIAAGALFLAGRGGYLAGGTIGRKILRFVIGFPVVALIVAGTEAAASAAGGERTVGLALRFIGYALTGGWVSGWGPAAFVRLGLAARPGRD